MLEMDAEELATYNGKDGKPVYIAHEGKVYDVSQSKMWKTGTHMRRHQSGADLTTDIGGAPHGTEVLDRYPRVGILKPKEEVKTGALERIFRRFPFLRRHPHPMTVHFPIVFMLSTGFFNLLFLATGNTGFEQTSYYCLAAGTFFIPLVMTTGFISWRVNYMGKVMRSITLKMFLSMIMLGAATSALIWRYAVPDVLTSPGHYGFIYLLLNLSLSPMVIVIGWYGAKLTFPLEKE